MYSEHSPAPPSPGQIISEKKEKAINVFATPESLQEVGKSCTNASQNENLNCDIFSDVTVTSLKLLLFIQSFHFPGLSDQMTNTLHFLMCSFFLSYNVSL